MIETRSVTPGPQGPFVRFLPSLLALALAGCAVGPDYVRPSVAVPAAYKEAAPGWKTAQPADDVSRGDWWTIFGDTELDALIAKANTSNQSIAGFAASYRQARALVQEARAAYFPTVTGSASETRSGSGSRGATVNGINRANGTFNDYSLSLDAVWEADVWGRIRRQVASQRATSQGAEADLANARLLAQATLAQDYFQLRGLDSTQRLLDDAVQAYQRSLAITRNRYTQGVAGRADVLLAQTQLQSARAAAVDNKIARARFEHAIAVLVGEPASTFSIAPIRYDPVPPAIPPQLPSALLERRPDVAAAERRAAAANEQIGVAIAAFFPSLSLSASGGFASTAFSTWLTAPARVWSLGPQLAATLFDGGLRRAQTEAARATYDLNVANYRETVLTAFQDVEDNLVSLRQLEQELEEQRQAVRYAEQALTIVLNEYKAGTVAYLDVITAQTTALAAEEKLINIVAQRMVSSVGLVKALGGGWNGLTADAAAPAHPPPAGRVNAARAVAPG